MRNKITYIPSLLKENAIRPMDGALFRIVLYILPPPQILFTSRKKLTSISCAH